MNLFEWKESLLLEYVCGVAVEENKRNLFSMKSTFSQYALVTLPPSFERQIQKSNLVSAF